MTDDTFEQELRRRLRESPDTASPGFTRGVLDRLDEAPNRHWITLRPRLAMAAALVVFALGAFLGARLDDAAESSASREQLVQEYLEMQTELEQLRRMADDTRDERKALGDDRDERGENFFEKFKLNVDPDNIDESFRQL